MAAAAEPTTGRGVCSPPDVIGQQRQVQAEREPLGRAQEHHAEEEMDEVLRENQLRGAEAKKERSQPRTSKFLTAWMG